MTPAPSTTVSSLTPSQLVSLLTSAPSNLVLLDARHPNLYHLEHILGSELPPSSSSSLCQFSGRHIIVYDAGATNLAHHFTRAVSLISQLRAACPTETSIYLLEGGIVEIKSIAPHLILTSSSAFSNSPSWARKALDALLAEAAPPGAVLPWLFVGGERHACNVEWLSSRAITHVITVNEKALPITSVKRLHIVAKDDDSFDLMPYFARCIAFLQSVKQSHANCLVHCTAGASRSVAVVAAFLITNGLSTDEALDKIRKVRKAADPNDGFLRQLRNWEMVIRDNSTKMHALEQQNDDNDDDDDDESMDGEVVREVDAIDDIVMHSSHHSPLLSSPITPARSNAQCIPEMTRNLEPIPTSSAMLL